MAAQGAEARSFRFREGAETKGADSTRYGFIAQEMERALPGLVHEHEGRKHVVYQDLIAVLTLAAQVQGDRLGAFEARARQRAARLGQQAARLESLEKSVATLTIGMEHLERRRAPGGARIRLTTSRR